MSGPQWPSRLAVLLFTDIVGSVELKSRLGNAAFVRLLSRHDELFRSCVDAVPGAEIVADLGDGAFALFPTVSDAVRASLCFQAAMNTEPWGEQPLVARVGIHVGEVAQVPADDGGKPKFVGMSADLAARLMSLSRGGQILLTRAAFDEARQFVSQHPPVPGRPTPSLRWVAHGQYLFRGVDDPVDVFEVGGEGIAPLLPADDTDKARRSVSAEEEPTLGWRPAVGLPVPLRPGWTLEKQLGEGAFGEVWLARHKKFPEPRVFKFCTDPERLRSLKRELTFFRLIRDALGDRPDIARLYDVQLDESPYFLESEYADGGNLVQWAETQGGLQNVPVATRLSLAAQVAAAVAAAHSVGILHKDIKPSNILVHVVPSAPPQPCLSDFGIGMLVDPRQLLDRQITAIGMTQTAVPSSSHTGTQMYMPPESLAGRPFTMQGDVYALGVLLYQLTIANLRRPCAPGWERDVPDDTLRSDIAASIEGDPELRLKTAAELATRLRHLDQRRQRRADDLRHRASAERRRRALRLATVVAILAAALATAGTLGYFRERNLRLRAEASDRAAHLAHAQATLAEGAALHLAGRGTDSRAALVRGRELLSSLGRSTYPADVGLARSYREFDAPINTLLDHTDGVMSVAWSPDGLHAASAGEAASATDASDIRLWDTRTGRLVRSFRGHKGSIASVAISPGGTLLLSGGDDRTVRLWNTRSGAQVAIFEEPRDLIRGVAFSPDGKLAAWAPAAPGGAVKLLDLQTLRVVRPIETPRKQTPYAVTFSPDSRRLAITTYDTDVWIFDLSTGKFAAPLEGHTGYVISAAFSPDGRRLVTGSYDRTLRLWDAHTGKPLRPPLKGHTEGVRGVAFVGPAADRILSCSMDETLKLWDAESGDVLRTFAGHRGGVRGLAVSPDGRRALSAGVDHTVQVWDLAASAEVPSVHGDRVVTTLSCSADGATFLSGDTSGAIRLRDVATLRLLRTFTGHRWPVDAAVVLPGARRLFTADSSGECRIWDLVKGNELRRYPGPGPGENTFPRGGSWCYTAVAPDGRFYVSSRPAPAATTQPASRPATLPTRPTTTPRPELLLDVRDLESGQTILTLSAGQEKITSVAVSPDSKFIVCGDAGKQIHYFDAATGRRLFSTEPSSKEANVDSVAFSDDGKLLLTGGQELTVRIFDLAARRELRALTGATNNVKAVAFARANQTVFAVGGDQHLRTWDASTGEELEFGAQFPRYGYALAPIPRSDAILVANFQSIYLYDVARSARYLEFSRRLADARAKPDDPATLATLGQWYAFRGVDDWAVDLLQTARSRGADVPSLTLARALWRLDRTADAAKEFRNAMARREAPPEYLDDCLSALTDSAARATTQPLVTAPATP